MTDYDSNSPMYALSGYKYTRGPLLAPPHFSSPATGIGKLPMHAFSVQVEKAPLESYADVGGLEAQIQEIKEAVELPLTHPEVYEDIGIKPPKVTHRPTGWPQFH